MKVKEAKYIVIYGYYDKETKRNEFISALGTYDNAEEAYGAAYIYLNDLIASEYRTSEYRNKDTISPLFPLEGKTGYGMEIRNGDENSAIDYAYIFLTERRNLNEQRKTRAATVS